MKKNSKIIIIALGGNALNSPLPPDLKLGSEGQGKGGYLEQLENAEKIAKEIAQVVKKGYKIVITHGNGPQVGDILLQQEYSKEYVPIMPLSVCGAQTQGQIGTILVNALNNELQRQNLKTQAVAIISHVLVNSKDPAFLNPSKPIGPIYTPKETKELKKQGMILKKIMPGAFRRVVPSPLPLKILELTAIKNLLEHGLVPIAVGGGGIPVVEDPLLFAPAQKKGVKLIDAVIDKDLATEILASQLKARELIILTRVKKVALRFQKSNQKWLDRLTLQEASKYLERGEFPAGSMGPKIEAVIKFLEKGGEKAMIGPLDQLEKILNGKAGTTIINKEQ